MALKLRKRKYITLHDAAEQLIFPIVLFSVTQSQYILYRPALYPIYLMSFLCLAFILIGPFLTLVWAHKHTQKHPEEIPVIEDMLLDNQLDRRESLVFYIASCYRKVLFGIVLSLNISGLVQAGVMIAANALFLCFQFYVFRRGIYKSTIKIISRSLNTLLLITIELLFIVNNVCDLDRYQLIEVGNASIAVALLSTFLGLL